MQSNIQLNSDFIIDLEVADFGADFTGSAIHRISFDFDGETGIHVLAEKYASRIFRACRYVEEGKFQWSRLTLRFARDAFAVAYGSGTCRIFTSSASMAESLFAEL